MSGTDAITNVQFDSINHYEKFNLIEQPLDK